MNPLAELKALLAPRRGAYVGTVISIDGDSVAVQSAAGRARALKPSTLILSVGDAVLVAEGNVQGRVKRAADVPVYHV